MFSVAQPEIGDEVELRASAQPEWYCLRTHPKHEHIAAAHLRQDYGLEAFLPRVRFRRSTRFGPAWVSEALFPGYLFARFALAGWLRRVQHARGVAGIVHFGTHWPIVPAEIIAELRAAVGTEEVRVIASSFAAGDSVCVASGPFEGLQALVTRVMPGPQRVAVLLDFLGRQTTVELSSAQLLPMDEQVHRKRACAVC
jgi:transcriptional antiterminator RfaH